MWDPRSSVGTIIFRFLSLAYSPDLPAERVAAGQDAAGVAEPCSCCGGEQPAERVAEVVEPRPMVRTDGRIELLPGKLLELVPPQVAKVLAVLVVVAADRHDARSRQTADTGRRREGRRAPGTGSPGGGEDWEGKEGHSRAEVGRNQALACHRSGGEAESGKRGESGDAGRRAVFNGNHYFAQMGVSPNVSQSKSVFA